MQKLIVRNFGPIRELDLEIKDLMLFIGEQATGKSTVAKLVYFFKKVVRDELMAYLLMPLKLDFEKEDVLGQLSSEIHDSIGWKFNQLFFTSYNLPDDFILDFGYKPDLWLHLEMDNDEKPMPSFYFTEGIYGKVQTSNGTNRIQGKLENVLSHIVAFRRKYHSEEWALSSSSRSFELKKKEREEQDIQNLINEFFGEKRETIFIPAGRSLFNAFSPRLSNNDLNIDVVMEEFKRRIEALKPNFRLTLQDLITQKKIRGNHVPPTRVLDLVLLKIKEILKGEYKIDEEGEKIYFAKTMPVKLSFASSGQQEALWILLQLFILILNREKVFLVIEEPEAHLFPQAQKSLVELIALLFNENESQVFITTHSPYILTSFNNLIYAGNVGKQHKKVSEIIPENLWLDASHVGAYQLGNGIAIDLMDEETQIIRAEEIDAVSDSIGDDFDAILNLELQ